MIPLLVDFSQKKVAIFGGGDVGARKAAFFAPEATVVVYSRSFSPALVDLPVTRVTIELDGVPGETLSSLLEGAFCAVAATPDAGLNNRIGEACRKAGVSSTTPRGRRGTSLSRRS